MHTLQLSHVRRKIWPVLHYSCIPNFSRNRNGVQIIRYKSAWHSLKLPTVTSSRLLIGAKKIKTEKKNSTEHTTQTNTPSNKLSEEISIKWNINHTDDIILEDCLEENCVTGFLSATQFPCSKKQKASQFIGWTDIRCQRWISSTL